MIKGIFKLIVLAALAYGVWYLWSNYDIQSWFNSVKTAAKAHNTRGVLIFPKKFGTSVSEFNINVIDECKFSPESLVIEKGAKVTWTNKDIVVREIIGDNFDSGLVNTGRTYSRIFNAAGTINYYCGDNSNNKGRIFVK